MITGCPEGYEVDHISLDTLDNRSCNLRIVTHQQNQINHSLQRNNSSGVSGVDFYPRNEKYRARIKVSQQEIHLGYYDDFEEAVQARNVGMECMFMDQKRCGIALQTLRRPVGLRGVFFCLRCTRGCIHFCSVIHRNLLAICSQKSDEYTTKSKRARWPRIEGGTS